MHQPNSSNITSPDIGKSKSNIFSKYISAIISRQSILVVLFLAITIAMGFLHLNRIKVQARGEAIHVVKSVLLTVKNSLDIWVTHLKSEIKVWSSSNELSLLTSKILQLKSSSKPFLKSKELKELRNFFNNHDVTHSAVAVSIISPDLSNVASLQDYNIGKRSILANQYSNRLADGFDGKTTFIPPLWVIPAESNKDILELFLLAPIKDDNEKVIALLSVAFDSAGELQELLELGQIGGIGEIYFFDKSKIARPMLNRETGRKNISGRAVLLRGLRGENIQGYQNSKGERVIGAWLWYKELGIGIASEMDEERASQLYYHMRSLIISIMSVMATLAFLLSFFLLKIRNRTEMMQKILNNAVEQANEAIVLTNITGEIEYVNPYFLSMTGFSKDKVIGQNIRFMKSGKHGENFYKNLWETITAGDRWSGEVINRRQSGELYEEQMTISPIVDKSGTTVNFLAIKKDVSKEKRLQKQLVKAEKLASIGTFASSVAHEINNPLTVVMGYAERLAKKEELPSVVKEELEIINLQSGRIVEIVKSLLSYSRTEKEKKKVDINAIIKSTLNMQAYNFKRDNVSVEMDFDNDLPEIFGNKNELQQVFTNIVMNAHHAMISPTGNRVLRVSTTVKGKKACITFDNSGSSIPKDRLDNIFYPFYTTKDASHGTGLGLYVASGIIKDHSGMIWAENLDDGVRFSISLPIKNI